MPRKSAKRGVQLRVGREAGVARVLKMEGDSTRVVSRWGQQLGFAVCVCVCAVMSLCVVVPWVCVKLCVCAVCGGVVCVLYVVWCACMWWCGVRVCGVVWCA